MLGTLQQLAAAAAESNGRLDPASLLLRFQTGFPPNHDYIRPDQRTETDYRPESDYREHQEASADYQTNYRAEQTDGSQRMDILPKQEAASTTDSHPKEEATSSSQSEMKPPSPAEVKWSESSESSEEPRLEMDLEPRPTFQEFQAGSKFASFAEFESAFEAWKSSHYHPFRVASSETLRMPDGSANELFKYRYIVYHCAHYGAPRMRGAGKRPNQNYLPCGCRAMLRLNFGWADNALRITTLNDQHTGHEVSADNFYKFKVKVRRPSATPPPRSPSVHRRTPSQPARPPTQPAAVSQTHQPGDVSRSKAPLGASNLAALSLAASFVQAQPLLATSMDSPVSANSDQENENPLDLRVERDGRSDEERFAEMHGCLQSLTDHLLACRGPDFDSKLRQLRIILRSWDLHKA